jgi:glycosyltransferase involved in cell wall biosynthesis
VLALGWHTYSFWQGFRAARSAGLPLVLRGESNLLGPRPVWKTLARRCLLKRVFRDAHAFLAIGSLNRKFYEAHGVPEEKIFEAPYFVDNERFASGIPKREETRRTLGLGADEFAFLFSGKLVSRKRPLDLLEAWSRLPPASREASRVVFAGDGELRTRLEERASAFPAGRVRCLGFRNQTELPDIYAAADAIVLPSDYGETWGLSVNEGMAAGARAIVSDRAGCAPDLVAGGVTGEVFACGNLAYLRGILQRLVQDRAWAKDGRQRQAVRDHVCQFSMERASAALRDIF